MVKDSGKNSIPCFYSMSPSNKSVLFVFLLCLSLSPAAFAQIGGTGWTPLPLQFKVQWPTNAARDDRYSVHDGVYHFRIFNTDGAFEVGNRTRPRTEQRFLPDYTKGEMQYQSMEKAPADENGYCIFQIHTGNAQSHEYGATAFMLFWFSKDGGSVHDYSGRELAANLGGKWFQLNVDQDVDNRTIKVWINKQLVWTQKTKDARDFYFKDGVYGQKENPSQQMEVDITDIRIWARSGNTQRMAAGAHGNFPFHGAIN
jgi:hypothetical protein